MTHLRNLLGVGLASVLGLSMPQFAQAQEPQDTRNLYVDMTRAEVNQTLRERTLYLNDKNFDKEVLDYDGAVMILLDSSCPASDNAANISTNTQRVYLGLMDKFDDTTVNSLNLKFAFVDMCKYNGDSAHIVLNVLAPMVTDTIGTHMYLDGREIDVAKGGPGDPTKTEGNIKAMSAWIDSTLLGHTRTTDDGRTYRWGYENTLEIHKVFLHQ